jgi:tetratricopeptide (TPR) repeat protein
MKNLSVQQILESNSTYRVEKKYKLAIELLEKTIKSKEFNSDSKGLFDLYYAQIENYFYANKIQDAIDTGKQLLEISIGLEQITKANLVIGEMNHLLGNILEAEKYYSLGYNEIKGKNFYELEEEAIYAIANLNQHYKGDYIQSTKYYKLALELVKKFNLKKISFYLDHLGMASLEQKQHEKAIDHHNEAIGYIENKNDINYLYHQIQVASVYLDLKNFEKVDLELRKFLEINKDSLRNFESVSDYGWVYLLIAQVLMYESSKIQDKTLSYLEETSRDPKFYFAKSIEFARKAAMSKLLLIKCLISFTEYLIKFKGSEVVEAEKFLAEAKEHATNKQYIPLLRKIENLEMQKNF